MRGKVYAVFAVLSPTGITPAYAGKRQHKLTLESNMKDHPRLCGEKLRGALVKKALGGSPPPMRGKVHSVTLYRDHVGITPAYAGKSWIFSDL